MQSAFRKRSEVLPRRQEPPAQCIPRREPGDESMPPAQCIPKRELGDESMPGDESSMKTREYHKKRTEMLALGLLGLAEP